MNTIEYGGKQYKIDPLLFQVKEQSKGGLWMVSVSAFDNNKRVREIHHIGTDLSLSRNIIAFGVPWKEEDGYFLWDCSECSPGIPVKTFDEVKAIVKLFGRDRKRAHRIFFGGLCACGKVMEAA